jgi:hypothetical protein
MSKAQTNFRAVDMLGASKPEAEKPVKPVVEKKSAAPRAVKPAAVVEEVAAPVQPEVEAVVEAPAEAEPVAE